MRWFTKAEAACAAFIERAFAAMFPSDLEPAQIARKLVSVMEARTRQNESTLVAPSRYDVAVHDSDYQRLAPHRAYLEEEWAALLRDVAVRVGIRFSGPGVPDVHLRPASGMTAGAIDVHVSGGSAGGSYVLRMLHGAPEGALYRIGAAASVGRSRDRDIFLVDPSVSRSHAELEMRRDSLIVRDLDSSNGTFVNGERVQVRTLAVGDIVAFGKTEMRVEAE